MAQAGSRQAIRCAGERARAMNIRLLPINTCGDCRAFVRTWEGASIVYVCTVLQCTVCTWETPRPPIPDDCALPKAGPGDDPLLVANAAILEQLKDD